ncbi:MAG TPA: hypothetical protein VID47_12000 [Actinomycetota bacterium]|jgi:hypothetical protein
MRFGRVHAVVTALALAVVTIGVVAVAGLGSINPQTPFGDHDRRPTLLLGTVGDAIPVAKPEDQRAGQGFGHRDLPSRSTTEPPGPSSILEAPPPAVAGRLESRITLAPRGPPPAVAALVNP